MQPTITTSNSIITIDRGVVHKKGVSRLSQKRAVALVRIFAFMSRCPFIDPPRDVKITPESELSYSSRFIGLDVLAFMEQRRSTLQPREAASIAVDVMKTLRWFHFHGIAHRDVKPENIVLEPRAQTGPIKFPWRARLIDFDEAAFFDRHQVCTGSMIGSPFYASRRSHVGTGAAPSDDAESLFYTLVFLVRGSLPWGSAATANRRLPPHQKDRSYNAVLVMKNAMVPETLCSGLPSAFAILGQHALSLHVDSPVDWSALISLFEAETKANTP